MNDAFNVKLRLSAQRALLGAITPQVRLVKVVKDGAQINFTVIAAATLDEAAATALSIAATEIIADFNDCTINENMIVDSGPLPKENAIDCGWAYMRSE